MQFVMRFLRSEDGPTAVEYAVMLVLIVIVCLSSISVVGQLAASSFNISAEAIEGATSGQ